jgi:hypothetical protein
MNESVALAKEVGAKKEFSPTKSSNSIRRARNEPERQLGSLRSVINNIRRDGGTPSVESISTELSRTHNAQRASALFAMQRTHGNRYVQRVVAGIQANLTIGQPNDIYEQEANQVADAVMRMPEPEVKRQLEEEENLQAKGTSGHISEVNSDIESRIQSLRGGGQPLPESSRTFFEHRFGHDFSQVRIHTDAQAAESARVVNARAFTTGQDVVFGTGQYAPGTMVGQRLLAHELTHVMQQASGTVIQRDPNNISSIDRLRQLLQDDEEDDAIELMGRLSTEEVRAVLMSREFKELAMDAFNNDEMYRGIRAMRGDLYRSLEWMFDEGTDWGKVRDVITRAPSGKDRVRTDNWMKNQFVSICNDEEMAEAVDLLQGTLLQRLRWMAAEGSNWDLVRTKIEATTSAAEKLDLYNHGDIRDFFVDVCDNRTIIIATRLLGGTWAQKTTWMEAEGVTAPVAGEMEEMLGEEATWVPSGPGSANTFESWASAPTEGTAPRLTRSTTINCWEMVLLAAYRVGVIDWNWIHNLYTAVPPSAWVSRMASSTTTYVPGTSTLSRGDLVFFNGLAHVALATGEGDKIYTFWPPPDKPSSIGTVDEVKISTIKALSDYMTPIWGAPAVTFGTPAW